MTDTPTRRLLQSCLQLQLAIMNDRDEKSSLITSPKEKFHLPSEIKLIICDMCDWNTILSLRATSVEWYGTVHAALAAGNASTRLKSALWYTKGKMIRIHNTEREDLIEMELLNSLQEAAAGGKLELKEYIIFEDGDYLGPIGSKTRIDNVISGWAPKMTNLGYGVHRIFGMVCIPDPEESCRLVLKEESMVHGLAEEFPGIISDADPIMATVTEVEANGDIVMSGSDGEEDNRAKAEDRKIYFGEDSLFHRPVKGPVPCRVRYKFSYPAIYYEMSDNEYETEKEFEYESSDTKLFIRRTDEENQKFVTVKDAWIALEKHLGLILQWEERLSVTHLNLYINPHGWLDITLSVNTHYTPSEVISYGSSSDNEDESWNPILEAKPILLHERSPSPVHSSDTSYCSSSPYQHPHPYSVDDVDDDHRPLWLLKSSEEKAPEGWAEEVDEQFESPTTLRRVVRITEEPYSGMGWYEIMEDRNQSSLTAYEFSKVPGFPGMREEKWEI